MKPLPKNIIYLGLVLLFFVAVSISCGLPVYYTLEPPTPDTLPNTDPASRYFSFKTADEKNADMDIYLGVNVYYKIYNDSATLNTDINSIHTSNVEYSDNGMRRLLNLGYNELFLKKNIDNTNDSLIPLNGTDRSVKIRLFKEGFNDLYLPGVSINDVPIPGSIPVRAVVYKEFDFFRNDTFSPGQNDSDVKYTSTAGIDVWYVNAYAVSIGRDTNFRTNYSSVLHLGFITIENNNH